MDREPPASVAGLSASHRRISASVAAFSAGLANISASVAARPKLSANVSGLVRVHSARVAKTSASITVGSARVANTSGSVALISASAADVSASALVPWARGLGTPATAPSLSAGVANTSAIDAVLSTRVANNSASGSAISATVVNNATRMAVTRVLSGDPVELVGGYSAGHSNSHDRAATVRAALVRSAGQMTKAAEERNARSAASKAPVPGRRARYFFPMSFGGTPRIRTPAPRATSIASMMAEYFTSGSPLMKMILSGRPS
jgi:hypothetical protein